ncbi:17012_t:CDS:2 [Funneliformis geosporum]|nr:17012_t:CDS:2 [Funneliformis geosporum]
MTKFLNLTIKIDRSDKYKNDHTIELSNLEIKDHNGVIISELKTHNSAGAVSHLKFPVSKAGEDERIDHLVSKVEPITTSTEWTEFYELENINNNEKSVEKMCQAAQVAKKNGFDLIGSLDLKDEIREGKYYGFPIASGEKYQRFITMTNSFFSHIPSSVFFLQEQARYTKKNIDTFREFFPNDKDQSDPKYFRGFRPGDIIDLGDGFYSAFHWKDLKDGKGFGGLHRKLTDLFSLLEKSYTNESKENCETASEILRGYENPVANSDEEAAANEDYGIGQLSNERKKIFTVHKSEIKNETILTEIKALIKSLVKAEKSISEFKNLDKMALTKTLKEEYQQGTIKRKDPQILLEESRNSIKLKYTNEAAVQAIFDNEALDSVAAIQAAERLLIKVREAQSKNDLDAAFYQQQAEVALARLQKRDQIREEVAKTIQEAKNESELEAVYNKIKDSELYKQGGKSRKVIRNLRRRKRVSFQLNQENFSAENKNFLQIALVKLIPETIKDDNGEQALTELENQLKTFKTAPEGEEKGQIYQKYQKTIDQVLNEICQEKQRYQQAKHQVNEEESTSGDNQKPSIDRRLPN